MKLSWTDAALAATFWLLSLYLFRPNALVAQRWSDRRAFGPRLLVLAVAISLSFQVDPLAAQFDQTVGINNLSWLLAYGNVVVAAYAGILAMVAMADWRVPLWLNLVTATTFVLLLLLFPSLAQSKEELHNHLPESGALLIYRELLYCYLAVIAVFGITIHKRWLGHEAFLLGRLRGIILMIALSAGVFFFVGRGAASLFVYLHPDTIWNEPLLRISNVLGCTAIFGLALAFAPPIVFQIPVRALAYIEQQRTLRDLEAFRSHLIATTGNLPWEPPSQRDRWRNTPYAMYCTLIDILDRRVVLQALIAKNDTSVSSFHRHLAASLDTLPATEDWVAIAKRIRQIARETRGQWQTGVQI